MSRDKNGQKDDFCCTNGIVECIHIYTDHTIYITINPTVSG